MDTTNYSGEGWLRIPTLPISYAGTATSNNMTDLTVFGPTSGGGNSVQSGWQVDLNLANSGRIDAWVGKSNGWYSITTGATGQSGNVVYVVETYDGTNLRLYTNGTLVASIAATHFTQAAGGHVLMPFVMGSYNQSYFNTSAPIGAGYQRTRFYTGGMAHVAVYNYTLNAGQVANHYFYGTNVANSPSITTQPASETNFVGQTATFTVSAGGVAPLYYQWKAGVTGSGVYTNLIAGGQFSAVTNATLSISSLTLGNTADFVVVVSNSYGSITSSVATLTVQNDAPPSIIAQPASQTNYLGLTATFTVNASGIPPLYYQWRAGATGSGVYTNLSVGGQYSGVTTPSLSISTLTLGNAADFVVVVSNSYGSVTSALARLTVTSNSMSGAPVKLMCIGDSITDIDVCWWRVDLATELVNAGYNYIMVGRRLGTLGPINQRHHEGWSGYTTSDIISMIPDMMAANVPDIAMVHIGANDLSGPYPNETADRLTQIVQGLQSSNANMTILVSQIIPCQLCGSINEYDYLIPQLCQRLQTRTSHVIDVDVFSGFVENTMFDGSTGPHPNAVGGQFMCDVYFPIVTSLLNGIIPPRAPLPPPWPGPPGYIVCAFTSSETAYQVNFPYTPIKIAWGANGHYSFFTNTTGSQVFTDGLGDPDPGFEKFGYVQQVGPSFTSASTLSKNQTQLHFTGVTNQTYTLQVCTNLKSFNATGSTLGTNANVPPSTFPISPPGWVSITSTNTTTNTSFVLTDLNATKKLGLYRAFVGP